MIFLKIDNKKGFTLIELLVTISIISLLSSVLLSSLSSARGKAADSAIKSNLNSVLTQSELYLQKWGSYGAGGPGYCPFSGGLESWSFAYDPQTRILLTSAASKSGGGTEKTACYADATGLRWAAAVVLKSSLTQAFCVDYLGTRKVVSISSNDARTAMSTAGNPAQCN